LKITLIGPAWPLRGGIANFNEALARALQEAGHTVNLVSFKLQYPKILFPGKTQFDTGPKPDDLAIESTINSINPFNWIKVGKAVAKTQPDLVIVRFWLPFMGPSLGKVLRKIKKQGIPIIAITDNVIPHESKPMDKQFTNYFLKPCGGFIAMSGSVLDDLSTFTDNMHKKLLPHPLYAIFGEQVSMAEARAHLNLDADGKYMLFFGLVRKYKGLDLLLEAMANSELKALGVKLLVAGEFYDDPTIYTSIIEKHGLQDQVVLRNEYIPAEEVKHYFCAANIIAQTYRTATQSGVTQIAYNFERPMLVTDVGGLAEIVPHNKAGYVVPTQPDAIATALVDFFANNKEATFTAGVRDEKPRFEWPAFVKGVEQLYEEIKG